MRALGCLFLIIILVAALWFTRDRWVPLLPHSISSKSTAAARSTWQQLTLDGAARARTALGRLNAVNGPDSVMITPGDLASYIYQELARTLPASADSIQTAAIGDRLYLSAVVRTADLGSSLGPMAALLGDRERVQLGGTIRILRPGQAELEVKEIKVRQLTLPSGLIPRIVQQMSRGKRSPELSPDGLPLETPPYVSAVRVSTGVITLFRAGRTADIERGTWDMGRHFALVFPRPMSYVPCPTLRHA